MRASESSWNRLAQSGTWIFRLAFPSSCPGFSSFPADFSARGESVDEISLPTISVKHTQVISYVGLVDRWSYVRRNDAEAHVRFQHGATNYGAFLARKRRYAEWTQLSTREIC